MKKLKTSLIAALATVATATAALSFTSVIASADDEFRQVSFIENNTIFYREGGADVTGSYDGDNCFIYFNIGKNEKVTFRKNLAYRWFTAQNEEHTFSMTLGFDKFEAEKVTIKFQSQQFAKTEDGVSSNYLTLFKVAGEGDGYTVKALLSTTDEDLDVEDAQYVISDSSKFEISFAIPEDGFFGNYDLLIDGDKVGQVENVFENFAKYVSSGTNAATPLTFTADFGDNSSVGDRAGLYVYELNGQSFEIFDANKNVDGNYSSGGYLHDDQAPALCLNTNLNYLTYGGSVKVDYTVIDVIASSPRATVNYYVLKAEDYYADDVDYDDIEREGLFTEVLSSTTVKLLRDQYTFVPESCFDADKGIIEVDGYKTYGLAKIYIEVKDTTSSSAQTDDIFVDWYVSDEYKVDVYGEDLKNDSTKSSNFIRIIEDKQGATYADETVTDEDTYKARIADVQEDYQKKINEALENLEDGKLYGGSESYFYLPDFSGYVTDNFGGYTDLKYSIYYSASNTGSHTSLASNQLAITLNEANVNYRFIIYVTDAAGNEMYYPTGKLDENGKPEYKTIPTSKVWDEEYAELLPVFTFPVSYKMATVEDPEEQTIGYVGTTYTSATFEIKGISGTYSTKYSLYVFDRDSYYNDTKRSISYSDFVTEAETLFTDPAVRAKYFKTIRPVTELHTGDEDYEEQSAYAWNNSSVTFVPQSASEFYLIRLELTDTGLSNQVTQKYMAIYASAKANEIPGENEWLKNNIVSVVLYCIAGVLLIALVILFIVKPKDNGDIDNIDLDKSSKKKDKKSKGNK